MRPMAMVIYDVFAPAQSGIMTIETSDQVRLVPDRLALGALCVPILWCLHHRLWRVLAFYVLGLICFLTLSSALPLLISALIWVFASLVFGLYGRTLQAWEWQRKGYQNWGQIAAHDEDEALLRFYRRWLDQETGISETASTLGLTLEERIRAFEEARGNQPASSRPSFHTRSA